MSPVFHHPQFHCQCSFLDQESPLHLQIPEFQKTNKLDKYQYTVKCTTCRPKKTNYQFFHLLISPVCGNLHQEEEILPGAGTKPVGAASGWTLYHLHDPASVVEEGVTCVRKTLHIDQLPNASWSVQKQRQIKRSSIQQDARFVSWPWITSLILCKPSCCLGCSIDWFIRSSNMWP